MKGERVGVCSIRLLDMVAHSENSVWIICKGSPIKVAECRVQPVQNEVMEEGNEGKV